MATVTKPPILDETGQAIATAIGNVSMQSKARRNIGELVYSTILLYDAGLHLADGSPIQRGAYTAFYDYIASLLGSSNSVISYSAWQTEKTANGGVIGKYGVDSANQQIYLPDLTDTFVESTHDANELGKYKQAGVPDIQGKTSAPVGNSGALPLVTGGSQSASGAFATRKKNDTMLVGSTSYSSSLYFDGDDFNASTGEVHNGSYSNLVYGKSDTVQPQAVKYYVYVVIANSIKPDYVVDIDNIMTDINTMDTRIDNASMTYRKVVETSTTYEEYKFGNGVMIQSITVTSGGFSFDGSSGYMYYRELSSNWQFLTPFIENPTPLNGYVYSNGFVSIGNMAFNNNGLSRMGLWSSYNSPTMTGFCISFIGRWKSTS